MSKVFKERLALPGDFEGSMEVWHYIFNTCST